MALVSSPEGGTNVRVIRNPSLSFCGACAQCGAPGALLTNTLSSSRGGESEIVSNGTHRTQLLGDHGSFRMDSCHSLVHLQHNICATYRFLGKGKFGKLCSVRSTPRPRNMGVVLNPCLGTLESRGTLGTQFLELFALYFVWNGFIPASFHGNLC